MESTPNGCIYKTVRQPRLRDYCGKGGRKDVRAKGSGSCCGIVSPGGTRICTRELSAVSAQILAGQAWRQRTWHMGWGRSPRGLSATQRTTGNWVKLQTEEEVVSRLVHTNWLSRDKRPTLKTHIRVTNGLNRLYLGTCMHRQVGICVR